MSRGARFWGEKRLGYNAEKSIQDALAITHTQQGYLKKMAELAEAKNSTHMLFALVMLADKLRYLRRNLLRIREGPEEVAKERLNDCFILLNEASSEIKTVSEVAVGEREEVVLKLAVYLLDDLYRIERLLLDAQHGRYEG